MKKKKTDAIFIILNPEYYYLGMHNVQIFFGIALTFKLPLYLQNKKKIIYINLFLDYLYICKNCISK